MRITSLMPKSTTSFSLAVLLGAASLLAPLMAAAAEIQPTANVAVAAATSDDPDIDIIIGGLPTKGKIVLPPTEAEFKFKLHATGSIVSFRWSALEEYERKRVQKLYGMEVADGKLVFGEKMTMTRYKLSSGKMIEGFREPERDRPGLFALRTPTALMMIPKHDVVSEESIECHESDVFSAEQIYQRRMTENAPGPNDAAAHLAMAKWCAGIALYGRAIEHLEQAKIIDPRTEERNQEFRQQLYQLHADQQADEIFDIMLREVRGQDYLSALDHIEQLDRSFKNSNKHSRWDAMRPIIEAGWKLELNRKIVQLSYRIADDLLKKKFFTKIRIDEKGNTIPSIPGKLVTTKQGTSYKGQLVGVGGNAMGDSNSEPDAYEKANGIARNPAGTAAADAANAKAAGSPDDVILKLGDTTITIAGKDVLAMIDIDLAVANKFADPTYDELKEYVTGADGLKLDMARRLSQLVKMPSADVLKIFDGRLAKDMRVENGVISMSNNYASFHDADYGYASWLRPGAPKPMKYIKYQNNANPQGSSANRYGANGTNGNNRNGRNNQQNQQQQAEEEETAESTDDPVIWWKFQTQDTRLKFLRALMAEKVFKVDHDVKVSCPTCSNKGIVGETVAGGNEAIQRCPTCRGAGVLYKLIYH